MWWLIGLCLLITICYIAYKVWISLNRYSAMLNAVMAKHAFTKLSPDEQREIKQQAVQILKEGGMTKPEESLKHMSEPIKFCFLGLAMSELGYPPPFSTEKWVIVRNPFIARGADRELWMAKNHLKKIYGIDVELDWTFLSNL